MADKKRPLILDPLQYIARVRRDEDGKVRTMEVIYEGETVHLENGDEFVTFKTTILLEEPPKLKRG